MKLDTQPKKTVTSKVETLIAVGLYKARSEALKHSLKALLREYEGFLKPSLKAAETLSEVPQGVELSEEVVAYRKRDVTRYLEG